MWYLNTYTQPYLSVCSVGVEGVPLVLLPDDWHATNVQGRPESVSGQQGHPGSNQWPVSVHSISYNMPWWKSTLKYQIQSTECLVYIYHNPWGKLCEVSNTANKWSLTVTGYDTVGMQLRFSLVLHSCDMGMNINTCTYWYGQVWAGVPVQHSGTEDRYVLDGCDRPQVPGHLPFLWQRLPVPDLH